MRTPPSKAEHRLLDIPQHTLVSLTRKKGFVIQCASGMVLLTIKHELRDIELRSGDCYLVPNEGLILIESIGGAEAMLSVVSAHSHQSLPRQRPQVKTYPVDLRELKMRKIAG